MFKLRPYQQRACDAALEWMRNSIDPCIIDAAPAAGKSFMVAYVAKELNRISGGKRVLCLMPNGPLLQQNAEKYRLTGEPCSIFSATGGSKSTRHPIVMATPKTVANALSRFQNGYCAVIVDEAHGMTPTIRAIIDAMRESNPNLRVLGLSGTPYVLNKGYVFRLWPDGRANGDDTCRDPYFTKCVYRVTAKEMLAEKFITPMRIGDVSKSDQYDTSGIVILPNGKADEASVERAFVGHGRKTANCVAAVIENSRNRPGGIMYFGATIAHCHEIMASLPPESSALVVGDDKNNKDIIKRYRDRKIRHLVSCEKLTTGFDVGHTQTIALLRYSESPTLTTQILGRAWRLDPEKDHSVVLDFAGVIDKHFPSGDIYEPVITAKRAAEAGDGIEVTCPDCGHINSVSINKDYIDYQFDDQGYALDVFGNQIMTDYGPMAVHYGRRCFGMVKTGPRGEYERCGYYWSSKVCDQCECKNDIAARFCRDCRQELVNPNDRIAIEFKIHKKNPDEIQTDAVISVVFKPGVSQKGNDTIRADWKTPYRQFSTWHVSNATYSKAVKDWELFAEHTKNGTVAPRTITYRREPDSNFYKIYGYDHQEDLDPSLEQAA